VARARDGSFVWVTWIAKLMAGDACCEWATWFRAHYSYDKQRSPTDFSGWQHDHVSMVRRRAADMRADGYSVSVEDQNLFRIGRDSIVLSGKPDVVGVKGGDMVVVDCKSGVVRDWHQMQLLIYMMVLPWARQGHRGLRTYGLLEYPIRHCRSPIRDSPSASGATFGT
jgi:PD-(D/E)XK nuclease superfamily